MTSPRALVSPTPRAALAASLRPAVQHPAPCAHTDRLHGIACATRPLPRSQQEKDLPGRPDEEVAAEAWANYRARNNSLVVDTFQVRWKGGQHRAPP